MGGYCSANQFITCESDLCGLCLELSDVVPQSVLIQFGPIRLHTSGTIGRTRGAEHKTTFTKCNIGKNISVL